jgi:hypothetical protein
MYDIEDRNELPSPDVIYSRDKEKKRSVCGFPALLGLAQDPDALGGRSDRRKEATRPAACYKCAPQDRF